MDAIISNLWNKLKTALETSGRKYDMSLIERAFQISLKQHDGQLRKSGEPYIIHPLNVATLITELGMDTPSVVAALLHDVVEDTDITLEEIERDMGKEIAALIDGVTKLGRIPYSSREEQQAENLRKMLMAMAEDIRVIIIKLADRLHNMKTICYKEPQKQRDTALETMEVFAPIAHRLGIRAIKEELEDLSIQCLDSVGYRDIEESLNMHRTEREKFIEDTKRHIKERVSEFLPNVYLEGRVKSINGIYRKMYVQGRSFDEIYDIYAVRVIVDSVNDCYNVLGIIHDMFRPIPNRFKDYISTPKPNGYQSLHTTVLCKEGIPFEVQIRTWDMHHTAEYGIAAHWKYKLGLNSPSGKNAFEERVTWIRKILEEQAETGDATEILRSIKSDMVPEEVYVFTPRGDVVCLPTGATVIDFAYAIHSAVGNRMIGAKVDGRIVPIDYTVKIGEIIEILTTKEEGRGPSRDWLKIVKTSEARSKIRQWFKKERREENIQQGKEELDRELKRNAIILNDKQLAEFLEQFVKKYHFHATEDFYAAIGYGGIQLSRLIPRMKEEYNKLVKTNEPSKLAEIKNPTPQKVSNGVIVHGVHDCLVKYSKCCNPLPGDDIIGFITRGFGVSIHQRSCKNVPKDLSSCPEKERWVPVEWSGTLDDEEYKTALEIECFDRRGLLADVTIQLTNMHINIHSLNCRGFADGSAIIYATVTVKNTEHINTIISRLMSINGINKINRT